VREINSVCVQDENTNASRACADAIQSTGRSAARLDIRRVFTIKCNCYCKTYNINNSVALKYTEAVSDPHGVLCCSNTKSKTCQRKCAAHTSRRRPGPLDSVRCRFPHIIHLNLCIHHIIILRIRGGTIRTVVKKITIIQYCVRCVGIFDFKTYFPPILLNDRYILFLSSYYRYSVNNIALKTCTQQRFRGNKKQRFISYTIYNASAYIYI
jgi:hypothetical protein